MPRWVGEASLLVDLVSMAVFFAVLPRFEDSGEASRWTLYVLPSLMMATLLSSFMRYSDRFAILSPEEVVRQLNTYHGTMLEQVERHGGTLDKFIRDGAQVVFGLGAQDAPGTDHGAGAALACARDMLRALERLNGERVSAGLPPLRMGIGLHTGLVVAGNIGVPGVRLEFTVIGDAVNTAARLEGLTKEAGVPVLISAQTATRLGAAALRELPAMRVRGKDEPMRLFTLPD